MVSKNFVSVRVHSWFHVNNLTSFIRSSFSHHTHHHTMKNHPAILFIFALFVSVVSAQPNGHPVGQILYETPDDTMGSFANGILFKDDLEKPIVDFAKPGSMSPRSASSTTSSIAPTTPTPSASKRLPPNNLHDSSPARSPTRRTRPTTTSAGRRPSPRPKTARRFSSTASTSPTSTTSSSSGRTTQRSISPGRSPSTANTTASTAHTTCRPRPSATSR